MIILFPDIDECASGKHNCLQGSLNCINIEGSFVCICDGIVCTGMGGGGGGGQPVRVDLLCTGSVSFVCISIFKKKRMNKLHS